MYDITRLPDEIEIGYAGEKDVRTIQFDMTKWIEQLPDGVPSIVLIRPEETATDAYIAVTTFDDNVLTWTVTDADVAKDGHGVIQIWMEEEESDEVTRRRKSAMARTLVRHSIVSADTEAPEPIEEWIEQLTAIKTATESAAEDADDAKDDAVTAKNAAEAAQTAAETAQGLAESWATGGSSGTPSATNNAKYYSDAAGTFAQNALIAKNDAVSAKNAAVNAGQDAQIAETNAKKWVTGTTSSSAGTPGTTNNARYYSETAQTSASNASASATKAEAWATGNIGGTPSNLNNAKYYSEQAAGSATSAATAKEAAEDARDAAQAAAGDFQGLTATASGLAAGSTPTVDVTHSQGGLYNIAFGIPKGDKGDPAPAEQVTTAVDAYLAEFFTNPSNPPLDRSLASSSSAAPADMVGSLKSALQDTIDYATGVVGIPIAVEWKYLKIQNNYVVVDNPQTSISGYGYSITPCAEGDVFTVSGISSNNEPMAWAFIKSDYEIITKAASLANVNGTRIVAPANSAYLVIHDKTPYRMSYKGVPLVEEVNTIKTTVQNLNNKFVPGFNLFNPDDPDLIENYELNNDGTTTERTGRFVSGYIEVKPGKTVCCNYPWGSYGNVSSIVFYNENKERITYSTNVTKETDARGYTYIAYTFADNTQYKYFRLTGFMSSRNAYMYVYADEMPSTYVPYTEKITLSDDVIVKFENVTGDASSIIGEQWKNKKWYAYGTSITNISAEGKYPTYLAQMSGMELTNKGISGGGIGNFGAISTGQIYNAICNIIDGKLEADLITLETGANDTGPDVPLGTIYDTGTSTLAGCLNDCLRYLQANTNAQIAVTVSPATTTQPGAASKYSEWAEMIERICHLNRVHFLNGDNNMGYGKISDSTKGPLYVVDSIHQTNLGGYIMAQNLWYQLRNIPCFYTAIPN